MSVIRCEWCEQHIDTDWDVEHFTADGKCVWWECKSGRHEWVRDGYQGPIGWQQCETCNNCGRSRE